LYLVWLGLGLLKTWLQTLKNSLLAGAYLHYGLMDTNSQTRVLEVAVAELGHLKPDRASTSAAHRLAYYQR
jgi:hypothetical protein